jgi:ABC-2 type transport system permease protein
VTQTMLTLVRREYWEHRSLWIAPAVVGLCVIASAAFGRIYLDTSFAPANAQRAMFGFGVWICAVLLFMTLYIVLWFYASDCLYAERRDRSILFWKSMPVSDTETVLSKLLVVLLVAPLIVYLMGIVTGLLTAAVWSVRGLGAGPGIHGFDPLLWLRIEALTLFGMILASLWYAPVFAYLLMVSAWARRNVSLWVFVPPIAAVLIEWEAFRTHYIGTLLAYRLGGMWNQFNLHLLFAEPQQSNADSNLQQVLRAFDPTRLFGNVDLWIGLAVAAAFVCVAIYIRRYRDET